MRSTLGMGQKHAIKSGNPERLIMASCKQIKNRLKAESAKTHSNVVPMVIPVPWRKNLCLEYEDSSLYSILQRERSRNNPDSMVEDSVTSGTNASVASSVDAAAEFDMESLDSLLKAVTLPTVPVVRNIISDVILDGKF
jgi:hypothetical protein